MKNTPPNIIVIMTDDQGYGDLSCMGSTDVRTPYIDRLAASGVRFTQGYSASPVCSPSRASLLTGRYPGNAGVRAILAGHRKATGITPKVPTIATALKTGGYSTACIGKWHLGLSPEARPNSNGFDYFYGFLSGCIDYFSHIHYYMMGKNANPAHDLWENDQEVYANGQYFTDMVTDKSVEFIRSHAGGGSPFFLYVGYNAPHYPMHAPDKYVDRFKHLPWDRRMMAAMLSGVDDGVGAITAELERQGMLENTIIYYQSDNGPSRESRNWLDGRADLYYGGTAGGLKGHKFSLYEGGIRVPMLISWPEVIPAGQVISQPVIAADVFPTLMAAAGLSCEGYELDGCSMLPVVTRGAGFSDEADTTHDAHQVHAKSHSASDTPDTTHDMHQGCPNDVPSPNRTLFWEMNDQTAMRRGRYKLVLNGVLDEWDVPVDVFLSDLDEDMSESVNLADVMPELTRELTEEAMAWRSGIEKRWEDEFLANYTLT